MKVCQVFEPYEMPDGALPLRCHVLKADQAKVLEDFLVQSLPECYASVQELKQRSKETGLPTAELLANKFPDKGSVMSGDFGEILTLFFVSSEKEEATTLIKKWRYKQDRRKAAPHSDVIIFYKENGKKASERDFVICAEAKQKATKSKFNPLEKAIEGFSADSTGRLARTLSWLREKAIDQESNESIHFLNRFTIDLTVKYRKYFKAVAVVDRTLLNDEINQKIDLPKQDESFEVVVLGVSDLKKLYEAAFSRAMKETTIE